jgi:DNA-directed RNA polymerase specialized sigma24 family protein
MKKEWVVTQEAFEGLLGWLDTNREQAGEKYEKIRTRLIKIFTCRGCGEADYLADETINRVTAKVDSIASSYSGDPALYFYGVAQKVHLEYLRSRPVLQEPLDSGREPRSINVTESDTDIEQEYICLDRCMDQLPPENRHLVLEYYREEKRAKINRRRKLADELEIAVNALRIRAHRIRLQLQQCVQSCLQESMPLK